MNEWHDLPAEATRDSGRGEAISSSDWRRIAALFEAAVELPRPARPVLLDRECGSDRAVRTAVEALLARHDGTTARPAGTSEGGLDVSPDDLAGRRLGHYDIRRELGRGGMGRVYHAWDTSLARDVAIKVLRRDLAGDAARCDLLRREARAAAGLLHPGIATIFSFEEGEGETFIVSEYVEGPTLRTVLDAGPLSRARLASVALDIASALAAAHERGVVHRDLKPDNVLLPLAGGVKIVDFGLAHVDAPSGERTTVLDSLSRAGMLVGTPAYMAPEQLDARPADSRADLFAFGVVLYEMATGRHPFAGRSPMSTVANVLTAEPAPLSPGGDAWLDALENIVRGCLQKSPELRYPTTARLVEDLEWLHAQAVRVQVLEVVEGPTQGAERAPAYSAQWWWNVHQVTVSAVDAVALVALWVALTSSPWPGIGRGVFFGALAAAVVEVALRLHLSFVARFQRDALARQRSRLRPALLLANAVLLLTMLGGVAAAFPTQPGLAELLFVLAVALLVSAVVIEPATTRAAFGPQQR